MSLQTCLGVMKFQPMWATIMKKQQLYPWPKNHHNEIVWNHWHRMSGCQSQHISIRRGPRAHLRPKSHISFWTQASSSYSSSVPESASFGDPPNILICPPRIVLSRPNMPTSPTHRSSCTISFEILGRTVGTIIELIGTMACHHHQLTMHVNNMVDYLLLRQLPITT